MKTFAIIAVLFVSFLVLAGCGTGLSLIPDMTISMSGFPATNRYTLVVINSTPFAGTVFANGKKVTELDPWSQHAIGLRGYYINYRNSKEVTFTVRIERDDKTATFSKRIWVKNHNSYSDAWEITSRNVEQKIRWSQ